MDDALELFMPYRLGLSDDVGTGHKSHLLDPLFRLVNYRCDAAFRVPLRKLSEVVFTGTNKTDDVQAA